MSIPVRVLYAEKSENDPLPVFIGLKHEDLEPEIVRVDTFAGFATSLESGTWDLLVVGLDSLEALRLCREKRCRAPFIAILDHVDEESVVELMRSGASDCLRRERISRLGSVARRHIGSTPFLPSDEKFKLMFENNPEPMNISTREGVLVDVNNAYCDLLGYQRQELIGKNSVDLGIWERRETWQRLIDEFDAHGELSSHDASMRTQVGESRTFIWSLSRLTIDSNEYLLWIGRDVTNVRMLESRIRQTQKLESIGTLAGGIAHDFNNILSVIYGYTELLETETRSEPLRHRHVLEILNASTRARDLIRQILTFSRRQEMERRAVQISLVLNETLKLVRATLPTTISVSHSVRTRSLVLTDPTELHQVFMNLLTNAYQAMRKRGGSLTVIADDIQISAGEMRGGFELEPGPYILITVSDTGEGIAAENLERIFEPYFTTKSADEGTGLGLSVVHGIVSAMGGSVIVESTVGVGTTFTLFLPIVTSAQELAIQVSQTPDEELRGTEHILLVDDEEEISALASEALRRYGYEVTAFTNSVHALTAFIQAPRKYDIVVSDQTMPGLTGVELVQRIKQFRDDIPAVLCTGYSDVVDAEHAAMMGTDEFLLKPISAADLAFTVRKALKRHSSR